MANRMAAALISRARCSLWPVTIAELEREIIRERVVAGVKAARANGKTLGQPKRVFRRDEAIRLRAEGVSWRKIAAELGVPVTTVVEGCRETELSYVFHEQPTVVRIQRRPLPCTVIAIMKPRSYSFPQLFVS